MEKKKKTYLISKFLLPKLIRERKKKNSKNKILKFKGPHHRFLSNFFCFFSFLGHIFLGTKQAKNDMILKTKCIWEQKENVICTKMTRHLNCSVFVYYLFYLRTNQWFIFAIKYCTVIIIWQYILMVLWSLWIQNKDLAG